MPRQRGLPGRGYAGPAHGEAVTHRCRERCAVASQLLEHLQQGSGHPARWLGRKDPGWTQHL